LFEGIEWIEKERFARAGNGFEVNPSIGNIKRVASARDGDLDFAALSGFAGLELLMDEEQSFGRRTGDVGGVVDLRRQS
jgi:hypothetical protein